MIALTNTDNQVSYPVNYNPYSEGQTVCNIFYTSDCVTIQGGNMQITLVGGETKVYVP